MSLKPSQFLTVPALLISPSNHVDIALLFSPQSHLLAPLPPSHPLMRPDHWAMQRHRAFSFSPASILHVSLPLFVWQCSPARPLTANRILGKKDKAKSITWLQSTLQRWSQEDNREFKTSLGYMRHSLRNNSKNVPKENCTGTYLLQCYSYSKSMVLTEKQTPRLGTE